MLGSSSDVAIRPAIPMQFGLCVSEHPDLRTSARELRQRAVTVRQRAVTFRQMAATRRQLAGPLFQIAGRPCWFSNTPSVDGSTFVGDRIFLMDAGSPPSGNRSGASGCGAFFFSEKSRRRPLGRFLRGTGRDRQVADPFRQLSGRRASTAARRFREQVRGVR
jgi:hypothetical protein